MAALGCVIGLARAEPVALVDDRGVTVRLPAPAARIVTLAPHLAETAHAAGAGEKLVGVARYSNYMDIDTREQADMMPEAEINRRLAHTRELLRRTGAHYVIDSIVELPQVIDDINGRLARGERP